MNGAEKALHGLAPKLNGLAPKRANSASVRRRKTNNPSLESLSSCRREQLAIDRVRAPRATQAVLEPGAIIYTLKVPTAAPYSSMHAWIGVGSMPSTKAVTPTPSYNRDSSEKVRTFDRRTHRHKPFDRQRFVSVLFLRHAQLRDLVEV